MGKRRLARGRKGQRGEEQTATANRTKPTPPSPGVVLRGPIDLGLPLPPVTKNSEGQLVINMGGIEVPLTITNDGEEMTPEDGIKMLQDDMQWKADNPVSASWRHKARYYNVMALGDQPIAPILQLAGVIIEDEEHSRPDDQTRLELAQDVHKMMKIIALELADFPGEDRLALTPSPEGLFQLDNVLIRLLETQGPTGVDTARAVRKGSPERISAYNRGECSLDTLMEMWRPPEGVSHRLTQADLAIAHSVWLDRTKPRLNEEQSTKTAALGTPLNAAIISATNRHSSIEERAGDHCLVDAWGDRIGHFDLARTNIDLTNLPKELTALRSVYGQMVIRYLAHEVWRQFAEGAPLPNLITIEGGFGSFAQILGFNSNKAQVYVKQALRFGREMPAFTFGQKHIEGLWTFDTEGGYRGKPKKVNISMAPVWIPKQWEGSANNTDPWLVAVPSPRMPDLKGFKGEDRGPALLMQSVMMEQWRWQSIEVYECGGALLTDDDLCRLADRAAFPHHRIPDLLDLWESQGPEPFIQKTGHQRYAPGESRVLEFYKEQGARRKACSDAGKAGAESRRNRLKIKS